MRRLAAAVVVLSLCASARTLAADTCPRLTILTSLDMTIADDGLVFVPMQIGGTKRDMLIDTGGFFNELTIATVDALHLTPQRTSIGLIGVSGRKTDVSVTTSFTLGNIHAEKADFMVFPKEDEPERVLPGAGGTIAPNLLIGYD